MRISGFILVIDAYLVRKGLASLLNRLPGIRISGEFDALEPMIGHVKKHGADFLVISHSLFNPEAEMFVFEAGLLDRTILLREDGTGSDLEQLPRSISMKASREELILKINNLIASRSGETERDLSRDLSRREITILRMLSMGLTNRQIADKLFLSTHTVTTHRKNIIGKLGIKSVSGLTIYAIVNNIITIEEVTSNPSQ